MDLKQFRNIHILHIVDYATRYCAGVTIKSKHANVKLENVCNHWTLLFGYTDVILSDNGGGEFLIIHF